MLKTTRISVLAILAVALLVLATEAQPPTMKERQNVRTVTIPISIFTKSELRQDQTAEFVQVDRLIVKEDKEEQTILSVRSVANTPLSLSVLLQEDLVEEVSTPFITQSLPNTWLLM